MRADQLIVQRGLAPTRSAAQRLIDQGAVRWRTVGLDATAWALPRKAGEALPDECELQVTDDAELRWVSRAGLKLDAALAHTGIDVTGATALDIGQSTGGFTDVLLARGAVHVVGVDVGRDQLHARMRSDVRVTALESVNARHLEASQLPMPMFDVMVADVSFISLTLLLPALAPLIAHDALMLVKPQFELQPGQIGKGGLVTDPAHHAVVETRIRDACRKHRLDIRHYFPSSVAGGDGNQEYFVWAQPKKKTT